MDCMDLAPFGPRGGATDFMGQPVMACPNFQEDDLIRRYFDPTKGGGISARQNSF